ncbi:MAG TPA: branched-chain amino acid ABC transporter permease, partial [Myxococcales bacterium]|nr:branched-chain amino acid ABC transporter permease [Myxococcales bacterium]
MEFFLQLTLNGLVVGSIYALVALGFVIIYKSSGILNFAQGEFLLLGGYFFLAMVDTGHVPLVWALVLTIGFSVLLGLAMERLILRPMIGEPIIAVIMVTIGLSTVFQAALKWIFGTNLQPFPAVFETQAVSLFGLQVQTVYLMSLAVSFTVMGAMAW